MGKRVGLAHSNSRDRKRRQIARGCNFARIAQPFAAFVRRSSPQPPVRFATGLIRDCPARSILRIQTMLDNHSKTITNNRLVITTLGLSILTLPLALVRLSLSHCLSRTVHYRYLSSRGLILCSPEERTPIAFVFLYFKK